MALNTVIGGVGASLALSGISSLLASPPKLQGASAEQDRNESFLFGGQLNRTTQGGCIPVVFGKRVRTGGTIVSVGLTSQQI